MNKISFSQCADRSGNEITKHNFISRTSKNQSILEIQICSDSYMLHVIGHTIENAFVGKISFVYDSKYTPLIVTGISYIF